MFANRRTSQKPAEEFYAAFKQSFPEVGPGTTSAGQPPVPGATTAGQRSASLSEAIVDSPSSQRPFDNVDNVGKESGTTPKPFPEQWRLTPSLMDPNSFAFSNFANQPPGYYTPTPGGFNTFYHSSAAGDLHTPGMGMSTPLSMPHSIHGIHASDPNFQYNHFNPHMLQQGHTFQELFHQQQQQQQQHQHQHQHQLQPPQPQQNQAYATPGHFLQHQDSGYAAMDDSSSKTTPQDGMAMLQQQSNAQSMRQIEMLPQQIHMSGSKFRFHTTLNAPTAMIRQSDEIPITYLNKGQAYTMSIFDTLPPNSHPGVPIKYRTYVRISFEDEQQRAKPGACWQLWKEGRGTNEAHQRGGKLLAVEYVDPNQGGGDDDVRRSQIELEKASFDGFAVTWYPNSRVNGAADCSISVRFNFLSTDFSHSKGVKGIPVRLCAKTELLSPVTGSYQGDSEVCFSKVKLFRDHGAERKLSNDVAHVKKSSDKLKQQISQAETGMGSTGKRKRSGSMAKGAESHPKKTLKNKRNWSADSDTETGRASAEEDLHIKLAGLQDMFSSTRPVSVLFLKGEPEDDPDLFPVKLVGGDEIQPIARTQTWASRQSGSESPTSDAGSPTPSSVAISPKRKHSEMQSSTIAEEAEGDDEEDVKPDLKGRSVSPSRPVKILKREHETKSADILVLDVDSNYKPPIERPIKPVACFYVKQKDDQKAYYRAIYIPNRSVKDLINSISAKFGIDSRRITQVTHVNSRGLHIIVDEDVMQELPEGQDMIVEFAPVQTEESSKHEFVSPAVTEIPVHQDIELDFMSNTDPLEMWLNY